METSRNLCPCLCTECVNSSVTRFAKHILSKFYRLVGHTTAAVQPGKKKISRETSFLRFLPNLETELLMHSVQFNGIPVTYNLLSPQSHHINRYLVENAEVHAFRTSGRYDVGGLESYLECCKEFKCKNAKIPKQPVI